MADQNQNLEYFSLDGVVTDQTKSWSGERNYLPPGDYLFKIDSVEKGESQNQNPVFKVRFEVMNDGEMKGKTLMKSYAVTEKAVGRLLHLLDACGIKLDGKKGFSPKAMIGKQIFASVTEETSEGEPNPVTGQKTTRVSSNIVNERPYKANGKGAGAAEARA